MDRLVSLDAFRGFIMFWIIAGDAVQVVLEALKRPIFNALVHELHHTPWQGLRFYDCIWPSFMLMTGVSIPFSLAKRSNAQTSYEMTVHAFKRAAVLFFLGSVRESVFLGSPFLLEVSSALQPTAIAYFAAFLVGRKSPKAQAAVGILILTGYGIVLAFVGAPGIPAGSYVLGHNLVYTVDRAVLDSNHWVRSLYVREG